MLQPFEVIYRQLLSDTRLLSLSTFKSKRVHKCDLFIQAKVLPPFFSTNLISESRVIKLLKGSQGIWRCFYYQLMRLGFQIESPEDYSIIIKKIIFTDPGLQGKIDSSPISGKQYSHHQYLRIIGQFFQILQSQVIPNFQMNLKQYPIFDEAMLYCLECLVDKFIKEKSAKIYSTFDLVQILSEIFQITFQIYDFCGKFVQSDVFIYVESSTQVYLSFLNQMAEIQESEKSSEDDSYHEPSQYLGGNHKINCMGKSAVNLQRKRIYNVQYTQTKENYPVNQKMPIQSLTMNVYGPESTCLRARRDENDRRSLFEDFNIAMVESRNQQTSAKRKYDVPSIFQSCSEIKKSHQRLSEFQILQVNSNIEKEVKILSPKKEENDVFFCPKVGERKKYFQKNEEQSLGTFYRQFSNTKVMDAMIQPYKTIVRQTRRKFKGISTKKFYGIM